MGPFDTPLWIIENQMILYSKQCLTDEQIKQWAQNLPEEELIRLAKRHPNQIAGIIQDDENE